LLEPCKSNNCKAFLFSARPFFAAFFRFTPPVLAHRWRTEMSTKRAKNESDLRHHEAIPEGQKNVVLSPMGKGSGSASGRWDWIRYVIFLAIYAVSATKYWGMFLYHP